MAWSYDRLWKLLIDKKLKKTSLIEAAHIHSNTLARMSKNEPFPWRHSESYVLLLIAGSRTSWSLCQKKRHKCKSYSRRS